MDYFMTYKYTFNKNDMNRIEDEAHHAGFINGFTIGFITSIPTTLTVAGLTWLWLHGYLW